MIDWNRVGELALEIGTDDFQEVADLFVEEVEEAIAVVEHSGPGPGLDRTLHFIKGSALNLGFLALADLCARGEKLAAAGNDAAVDRAAIAACFAASRHEFAGWRQRLAAPLHAVA